MTPSSKRGRKSCARHSPKSLKRRRGIRRLPSRLRNVSVPTARSPSRHHRPGPATRPPPWCKDYGKVEALRGIDLEVNRGEMFALLGPNGAGKTTLFSILATLRTPTAGFHAARPGPGRGDGTGRGPAPDGHCFPGAGDRTAPDRAGQSAPDGALLRAADGPGAPAARRSCWSGTSAWPTRPTGRRRTSRAASAENWSSLGLW